MNKSFTLIEILVVIVIIGILSGFIIVSMAGVSSKATIAKSQVFANSLRDSLLMNLVSEWKLDQANNPSTDQTPDSWGANPGTLKEDSYAGACDVAHCPQLQTSGCVSGNCFLFDGTNDYITINSAPENNNKTLEAWFYAYALSNVRQIAGDSFDGGAGSQRGYILRTSGANVLATIGDGSGTYVEIQTPVSLRTWYHVVLVHDYDNSKLTLYVNGSKINDAVVTGYTASSNYFVLGKYSGYNAWNFSGLIDSVLLYNSVPSSSRIQQNYFLGLNELFRGRGVVKDEYIKSLSELKQSLANNN